jgi:hypothetical protein
MKRTLGNKSIQYGYNASQWTLPVIAVYIKDTYGVNCSNFKLQKLLKELEVRRENGRGYYVEQFADSKWKTIETTSLKKIKQNTE